MHKTIRITKTIAPITALALLLFVSACKPGKHQLPIKGPIKLAGQDTIYHQIPSFSFINQNRDTITEAFVKGKVYVADFFFVSCPTICQEMARNMKTVYEKYKDHENFAILSHTIAPRQDTPERLNAY
ncbi:MAG: SCO family protein, partial [Bacteroidetes bacterium]|nr:SCO family protein [Bacteroidota bacterium]